MQNDDAAKLKGQGWLPAGNQLLQEQQCHYAKLRHKNNAGEALETEFIKSNFSEKKVPEMMIPGSEFILGRNAPKFRQLRMEEINDQEPNHHMVQLEVYVIKHWPFYWNVKTVSVLFNQRQGITFRYLYVWMPAERMWVVSTVGKRELLLSGCFGVEVQAILLFWPGFAVAVGLLKLVFLGKHEQNMNETKKVYQNNIYQNILKNTCKNTPWKWRK